MLDGSTIPGTLLILTSVALGGLLLGQIQVFGIELGVSAVLFAGLAAAHLGAAIDPRLALLVRDLGLVLFVYAVGVRVGPGFVGSLKRHGLPLNLAAAAIVLSGVALAVVGQRMLRLEPGLVAGVLSGATTNTPSLAAAQQTIVEYERSTSGGGRLASQPGLGYAVAYPFGVVGTILAMLVLRRVYGVDVAHERDAVEAAASRHPTVERANLEVTNPNLQGLALAEVPALASSGIVVSRVLRDGMLQVPQPDFRLQTGDVLLAVGARRALDGLRVVVGTESTLDLTSVPGSITSRNVIVTRAPVVGRTLAGLGFPARFGVQITRVNRAEVEMSAAPGLELQYGDQVLAVGEPQGLASVAAELGDSRRSLEYPQLAPMFLAIALGILLGTYPLVVPGVDMPVKLGLAGGPLLVAILFSAIGRVGPLIWYMPSSANVMLREIGLVLFMAVVGLQSGQHFMDTLVEGSGLQWMALGAVITLVPALAVGTVMRSYVGLDYVSLCGLLAGSMTAPASLSFATRFTGSEVTLQVYATVYPLVMILRVVSVQVLTVALLR